MFNREKALMRALRTALAENALLKLQVTALRHPGDFKWAFVQVDCMFKRLINGPRLAGVDNQG